MKDLLEKLCQVEAAWAEAREDAQRAAELQKKVWPVVLPSAVKHVVRSFIC